jgi:L-lactate dehydrogenase complex protein LldG
MSSRNAILADIRQQALPPAPLPALDGPWIRFPDPREHFFELLKTVGGQGRTVRGSEELRAAVATIGAGVSARRVFSAIPAAGAGNVAWEGIDEPHDLADVDLAVLPGELAVAENAAVWVMEAALPQRSVYFLAQHLVLVVAADQLVHNMHEAYAWLAAHAADGRPFANPGFGTFLSGPSKTADIEQALVIGAHGPRSLNVLLAE